MTTSRLPVPQYRPFLKLVKQPVLLPNAPTAFTQNALLVSAEVYLQVALLRRPVVTVRALEGLLAGVRTHVKGQYAVEAEALSTQRARVLPVLAAVVLGGIYLGDDALIGDSQELRKLCSPVHTAEDPRIHDLIGQKRHLAPNWIGGRGNEAVLTQGLGCCYSMVVRGVYVGQSEGYQLAVMLTVCTYSHETGCGFMLFR